METLLWTVLVAVMSVVGRPVLERVDVPIESLEAGADVVFVGTCTRIESKKTQSGSFEDTTYFHHMKVERVMRDAGGLVHAGDSVAVVSNTRAWTGRGQPPTYGSGHRGMPGKNERSRVYCTKRAKEGEGKVLWLDAMAPNGWQAVERTVMFIGADDEYKSEVTIPRLAEWLAADVPGVMRAKLGFPADPATGALDVSRRDTIANIADLRYAETAVLFMRWRDLGREEWERLSSFLETGRPVVGLRTSTHMFRMTNPALLGMNDDVPVRVWGQKWISHAGSDTRTRVLPPASTDSKHPILRGIEGGFTVRSWLYHVDPVAPDCTVLLWGEVVKGDGTIGERQPIVWVREGTKETAQPLPGRGRAARRMAFTTLGHPMDFEQVQVRRLVEQMVLWAMGDESAIPAEGVSGAAGSSYVAPGAR
jgi:hypothetical protein